MISRTTAHGMPAAEIARRVRQDIKAMLARGELPTGNYRVSGSTGSGTVWGCRSIIIVGKAVDVRSYVEQSEIEKRLNDLVNGYLGEGSSDAERHHTRITTAHRTYDEISEAKALYRRRFPGRPDPTDAMVGMEGWPEVQGARVMYPVVRLFGGGEGAGGSGNQTREAVMLTPGAACWENAPSGAGAAHSSNYGPRLAAAVEVRS